MIYNITGERSRKTKLQTLSREFLSERIQESRSGHCSIEDSLASLKLTQLKLKRNICFGDAVLAGFEDQIKKQPHLGTTNYGTNLFKQTTGVEKKACIYSFEDVNAKYKHFTNKNGEVDSSKIKFNTLRTNEEIVNKLCENMNESSLNLGHVVLNDNDLEENSLDVFKNVDEWSKKIFNSSLTPGLNLIIFSGSKKDGGNGLCFIKLKRL